MRFERSKVSKRVLIVEDDKEINKILQSFLEQNGYEVWSAFDGLNGSSSAWANKKVGGVGTKMFSRRFDIEMRTQFVYSYDAATEKYTQQPTA